MSASSRDYDRDRALYDYAVRRALSVLVGYAACRGRGWHHLADGEVIVAAEMEL